MDLLKSVFKGNKVIWVTFLFLCFISITEVFSAAGMLTYKSDDRWGPITQHNTILMMGAVIVVLMRNIPYKWFQVFPVFLLPTSAVLLVLVMMMERINGATRQMTLMGIQFQPSEITKMAVTIVTAFILSEGQDEDEAHPEAFKRIMTVTGTICLLIALENLSTATLLLEAVFLMIFIGRVSTKRLLVSIGGLTSVGVIAVISLLMTKNSDIPSLHRFDTWCARIEEFTSDEETPAAKFGIDKDAQMAHAHIAVAISNVVGEDPGNSVQHDLLSQIFSGFIFAVVIEELGLVGGITAVFFYVYLLIHVGCIAKKCDRTSPAFLIIGIVLLPVSQTVFNMMVAVGLALVMGQPSPLISKGGISTLINYAYIDMILNVSRYAAKLEEQNEHDALPTVQVETNNGDEGVYSETQSAAELTAKTLSSDTGFE